MPFKPGVSGNLKGRPPKVVAKPSQRAARADSVHHRPTPLPPPDTARIPRRVTGGKIDPKDDRFKEYEARVGEREQRQRFRVNQGRITELRVINGGKSSRNDSGRVERNDSWANLYTQIGTSRDKRTHTHVMMDIITDTEAMNLYRADDICKKVIEARPKTAFRRDYTINISGEESGSADNKEIAEKTKKDLDSIGLTEKFIRAACYENAYGGSALLMITDDVADIDQPIDDATYSKLEAVHVLEPRELQPVSYYTDIKNPKFGQPELWRFIPMSIGMMTTIQYIHESRLVIFPGIRVTRLLQGSQRPGFGDSNLCGVYSIIRDFGSAWGTVASLLQDFAQGVLSMEGYAKLMQSDDGEKVIKRRLRLLDQMRSAMKMMVMDEKDKFTREQTPMTGLSDILHDFALRVAAAAGQPVTVMFGMAPAGLNATGDNDVRGWYDEVAAERNHRYKPRLARVVEVYLRGTKSAANGNMPDNWSVDFPPLWEPTELEQAQTRKLIAETDQIYYNMGLDADDILNSRFGGDQFSAETIVDWVKRKKQVAAELAMAKLAQKNAMNLPPVDPNNPNAPPPPPNAPPPPAGNDNLDRTEVPAKDAKQAA